MTKNIQKIAEQLELKVSQVAAVVKLLQEDATIPFIARYRKETTGSLDEIAVQAIQELLNQLLELDQRRAVIIKSLENQGKLSDELQNAVMQVRTLTELEDIYLPFKPKRRTKGMIAREKGLEPLATEILEQKGLDPQTMAETFIEPEKGVACLTDALEGAGHIIAEIINEDPHIRALIRQLYLDKGEFITTVVEDKAKEGAKFKDYFNWHEPVSTAPSHRVLAMRRGEKEDILNLNITPPRDDAIATIEKEYLKGSGPDSQFVGGAVRDCFQRLLGRSMETEIRLKTKEKADHEAIAVFAENLRQLLLDAPLGAKRLMGIDPGFRSGCKFVCLDPQGKLVHHDTFQPHTSKSEQQKAKVKILKNCTQYEIEAIAVGNGTAGRETLSFLKGIGLPEHIEVVMVNESGASVYSASDTARQEFGHLDLTVRGAVSIGRRLMDPLAELVKIDPKSIGVGQYQHDVDQGVLKKQLDLVVGSCVNMVGVDLNRASMELLTYVSGLGPGLAKNIIAHRDQNGPFTFRKQLKDVKRLGPKAFEQSAGFLRITDGANPLDASAVHPESYAVVDAIKKDLDCTVEDLLGNAELRKKINLSNYVSDKIGLPTLQDIMAELEKPGRDPRKKFETFEFAESVNKPEDLSMGMRIPGIITNITAFGAFVDIGVHQDGLVHISEMADQYVKNPAEIVKVHQKVMVTVLEVDTARGRIGLSLKSTRPPQAKTKVKPKPKPKPTKKPAKNKKQPFHNPFAELLKDR